MKNFNKTATLAILLALSIAVSILMVPTTSAHTPKWNIPTFAYINAAPNPIGVGQKAYIIMWLSDTYDPASLLSNNYRFQNYKLTITAPDNTVTTQTFATVSRPNLCTALRIHPYSNWNIRLQLHFPRTRHNHHQ